MGRGSRQEDFSRKERKGGCICKETEEVLGGGRGQEGKGVGGGVGVGEAAESKTPATGKPRRKPTTEEKNPAAQTCLCLPPEGQLILDSSF